MGILQLNKHALQKRQGVDLLGALWQIPLFKGVCGLSTKVAGGIYKKLDPILFGPLGKAWVLAFAPAEVKKLFIKVCPKFGIVTGSLVSALNPAPGAWDLPIRRNLYLVHLH